MTGSHRRGCVVASCGCEVDDLDTLVFVRWKDELCDAVDGFHNAVSFADFCPVCAERLKATKYWIGSDAEEEAWLSSGRPTDGSG